jgi:hypothetical protein
LLQLDKALGTSQVLVSGALANLTLSKRSEISDKPSVNETLKDSLMKSSLMDTMFGLSLQKVQEEVSKAPQSVSINVRLNDGKRTSSGHKVSIQNKKVYDWSHSPLFLGDQEETGIKSWTQGRSWNLFYCCLLQQNRHFL